MVSTLDAPKEGVGPIAVGMLVYPGVDQLDFTGPFEVLSRLPDATVEVLWKTRDPVRDVRGLLLTPTRTLAGCPPLDVLVVPGGYGQQQLMEDAEVLAFLRDRGARARQLVGVCTGALLLGAAGLLRGRRATTHWMSRRFLAALGAIPSEERVVVDGQLVTSAGVTAGIDAALTVAGLLCGDEAAQRIQLYMEYDPMPPYRAGSPRTAPPQVLRAVTGQGAAITAERQATIERLTAARERE
jgi:cyclohexyl-isocyanide hydratase